MSSLEKSFDKKVELIYPRTKSTVVFFNLEDQRTRETQKQVIEHIEKTIASRRISKPGNFELSWEGLLRVLMIKTLPKPENEI